MSHTGVRGRKDFECVEGCGRITITAKCSFCRNKKKVVMCRHCQGKGHSGGFLCGYCMADGYI